jgi:hypothetical protein
MTVESAVGLINRSDVAAGGAINRLVEAGILNQRNVGKQRYRIFEAPAVLDLFTLLERALASPTGDTAEEPPTRVGSEAIARKRVPPGVAEPRTKR